MYENVGSYDAMIYQNLTVDMTRPTLSIGRLLSTDPAIIGSSITVVLEAGSPDEVLSAPDGCTVNGVAGLEVESSGGGFYSIVYVVGSDDDSVNRTISVDCQFYDSYGFNVNEHETYETTFAIDATPPRFSADVIYASPIL